MLARFVFIAAINAPESGFDRMQVQFKKAAVPVAAPADISGSGIIPEAWLSRVQVTFVIYSRSPALKYATAGRQIKTLRGVITRSVFVSNSRQPGSLSRFGFRPIVLRRHLSVTLPLRTTKLS
jgi:hypothetical protein